MATQWDRCARLGASVGARARRRRRAARGGAPGDCWRRPDSRQARSCASARPPRRACGACCAAGARRGPRARSAGAYTGGRSSQALSSSGAPRAARRPPFAPAQSASRGGWTRAARAARERRVLGSFGRAPAWPGHWRAPLSRARAPFAKVSTQLDAQCPHCPWRRAARAWQGAGRWGRLGRRWWCCCTSRTITLVPRIARSAAVPHSKAQLAVFGFSPARAPVALHVPSFALPRVWCCHGARVSGSRRARPLRVRSGPRPLREAGSAPFSAARARADRALTRACQACPLRPSGARGRAVGVQAPR